MLKPIHLKEGFRIFWRSLNVKLNGIRRYKGNSKEICHQIIKDCYNQQHKYFQVSNGHFCEFYSRDFGWVCRSLLELGYKKEVRDTLDYALGIFKKNGRIKTSISPSGKPFDFPDYSIDSLAFILHSLALLKDKSLNQKYENFLNTEIAYLFRNAVEQDTGLVRKDRYFSSMKDYAKRKSSCYDNCMLYLLQVSCRKLKLVNPLRRYNYTSLLKKHFWTGSYFLDDLSGKRYVAGDANVFPFWTGVIKDKEMLKSAVSVIQKHDLDKPFPLRYTHKNNTEVNMKKIGIFAKDYERHVIWTHMGPLYIEIIETLNRKLQKKYLIQYRNLILRWKNYLEVFMPTRLPYSTLFYYSDEGMIWCANFLCMMKKARIRP